MSIPHHVADPLQRNGHFIKGNVCLVNTAGLRYAET